MTDAARHSVTCVTSQRSRVSFLHDMHLSVFNLCFFIYLLFYLMPVVCNASGCKKIFKNNRSLNVHRKTCRASLALIRSSASKLKSIPVNVAKIRRTDNAQDVLASREILREELNTVSNRQTILDSIYTQQLTRI